MPTIKKQYSQNKYNLSRYIPEEVARQVRKRCGFGCVICGLGIYEYEHFKPEFKVAREHNPDGITLLCPNHHTKKTTGKLSHDTVEHWNSKPKALSDGFAKERLDLLSDNPTVTVGNVVFEQTPVMLKIEDEPILEIRAGEEDSEPFLLSAKLRDKNGDPILIIDKNEWQTPSLSWDCRVVGNKIEIRSAPRKIELILRLEPPTAIVVERILMSHKGYKIEANEGQNTIITTPSGIKLSTPDCRITKCEAGIILQNDSLVLGFAGQNGGKVHFSGSLSFGT